MQNLIFLVSFMMLLGCASTPSQNQQPDKLPGLDKVLEDLQEVSRGSIEQKRKAAIIILENWGFDGGFWSDQMDKAKVRPEGELRDAIKQLTRLYKKRQELPEGEELSDFDLGTTLSCWLYITAGLIKHNIEQVLPQITKILTQL